MRTYMLPLLLHASDSYGYLRSDMRNRAHVHPVSSQAIAERVLKDYGVELRIRRELSK